MTMGLHNGTCTVEQLEEAKNMIPAALEAHLVDLYKNPNLYDRSHNSNPNHNSITCSPLRASEDAAGGEPADGDTEDDDDDDGGDDDDE